MPDMPNHLMFRCLICQHSSHQHKDAGPNYSCLVDGCSCKDFEYEYVTMGDRTKALENENSELRIQLFAAQRDLAIIQAPLRGSSGSTGAPDDEPTPETET